MAAPMSCTNQSVFCCILRISLRVRRQVCHPPPMDHGSMSRLMFGLTKATRPPRKMRQRMRQKCVCCVVRSLLCCQKRSTVTVCDECKEHCCIVLNVLTPTLVGAMLFVKYNTNDSWSGSIHSYCFIMQRAL